MSAPAKPSPWPGAPEYFRRLWTVVIYGIACSSDYAEDRQLEREAWRRDQTFMAWHFSPLCPEGEPGLVALAEVEPISAEEFAAAREAGWPQEITAR